MTTGLTNAAMLAVMLLHAAFGCCWHHSHAACAETAVERAEADHRCDCDHSHGDEIPPSEEEPVSDCPHGGGCTESDCSFATSPGVEAPAADLWCCGATAEDAAAASGAAASSRLRRPDEGAAVWKTVARQLSQLCVWRL